MALSHTYPHSKEEVMRQGAPDHRLLGARFSPTKTKEVIPERSPSSISISILYIQHPCFDLSHWFWRPWFGPPLLATPLPPPFLFFQLAFMPTMCSCSAKIPTALNRKSLKLSPFLIASLSPSQVASRKEYLFSGREWFGLSHIWVPLRLDGLSPYLQRNVTGESLLRSMSWPRGSVLASGCLKY